MSLTKEDVRRAAAIMESILSEWSDTADRSSQTWEEESGNMLAVQGMLDVIKSPLFSALVDIRDQCKRSVQESEQWNETAEVRQTDKPEVVAQFRQKYNIAGSHENRLRTVSASTPPHLSSPRDMDHLIDDITLPSSHTPQGHVTSSHALIGSTLNEEHHRNPSVSSTDSWGSTGEKGKRGKRKGSGEGVTLGHLAHTQSSQAGIPLKTLKPLEVGVVKEWNSESSLSSLASETSPPPVPPFPPPLSSPPPPAPPPHSLPASVSDSASETTGLPASPLPVSMVTKNEEDIFGDGEREDVRMVTGESVRRTGGEGVSANGDAGGKGGPRDILFFMRDKKSMTDVRTALNGKWGRDPREVTLPCVPDPDQIGMELCGLANTGVYVAEIREVGGAEGGMADRLQVGDQILKINGQSTENMAWFEVSYLMKGETGREEEPQEGGEGGRGGGGEKRKPCTLLVQYNPAGLADFQRSQKKQSN